MDAATELTDIDVAAVGGEEPWLASTVVCFAAGDLPWTWKLSTDG